MEKNRKIPSAEKRDAVREKKKFDAAKDKMSAETLDKKLNNYKILNVDEAKELGFQPSSEYNKYLVLDKKGNVVGWFFNYESMMVSLEAKVVRNSIPKIKKCQIRKKVVLFGGLNTTK